MIHVECSGPAREWRGRSRCARTVSCGVRALERGWVGTEELVEEQHSSQLEATLRRLDFSVLHCIENRKIDSKVSSEIRVTS